MLEKEVAVKLKLKEKNVHVSLDYTYIAVETKHCYGVRRSEDRTMVEYNLDLEAFFHAMEALNWAVRVSVLVEEKGQPQIPETVSW